MAAIESGRLVRKHHQRATCASDADEVRRIVTRFPNGDSERQIGLPGHEIKQPLGARTVNAHSKLIGRLIKTFLRPSSAPTIFATLDMDDDPYQVENALD